MQGRHIGYDQVVRAENHIVNGGRISGSDDGVSVTEGSFFTMNGGSISGNKRRSVLARTGSNGSFTLCGGTITGKIRLEDSVIVIGSKLDESSCYKIEMNTPGVFTSGLNGKGTAANFDSAGDNGFVELNDDGEAMLFEDGTSAVYIERSWSEGKVESEKKAKHSGWQAFPENDSVPAGWYYLNRDVTVNGRVSLTGDTYLILGDGKKLDVKGLYIPEGSTLTIYGQTAGTGKIYSHPSGGAAIGGYSGHDNGNIVIHGGMIEANGYDHCAGIGSNDGRTGGAVTIYGGTITAKGGSGGAAIGGGRNCDGGTITIYGGDITANGSTDTDCCENGAGIGGGRYGSGGTIAIYGGTVTTYSRDGAGIGGGDDGGGGSITIHGGTITSTKVNLINAKITGNTSVLSGGGIYNKGTLNISGASVISGNSAPDGSNVYMTDYGPALQVTGELDQDCRIGVTIERKGDFANGLFTNGLPGRGTVANFVSDDSNFAVSIHDDGEAYLDGVVTVTFDSDGGSEVEAQTLVTGRKAVRPEDPAKDGFTFKDWYQVTDADTGTLADTAFDFENTAVSESITLKAVWEESSEDTVIIKSANVEFQGKIRLK